MVGTRAERAAPMNAVVGRIDDAWEMRCPSCPACMTAALRVRSEILSSTWTFDILFMKAAAQEPLSRPGEHSRLFSAVAR